MNSNNFFIINNCLFVYIYIKNHDHRYKVELINGRLYLFIKNKNNNRPENFKLKITLENKESIIYASNEKLGIVDFGEINTFNFVKVEQCMLQNIIKEVMQKFPNFDFRYYVDNNNYLNLEGIIDDDLEYLNKMYCVNGEEDNINGEEDDINVVKYKYEKNSLHENRLKYVFQHWLYFGQNNEQTYYKYVLHKNADIILNIDYPKIKYSKNKKNTLLFIDDRFDPIFKYILILFLNSVNESWNLNIYTIKENVKEYENVLKELCIEGCVNILYKKFRNIDEYSNLLKSTSFWDGIKEENCLLFQYDSFAMGKFKDIFFEYNYIGAEWDHCPLLVSRINVGNGGTSFRKKSVMRDICLKYSDKYDIKKKYPEDVFFCEALCEEYLHNCPNNIARLFSFENIFCENSVYGHQIYKSIKLEDLDEFISNVILKIK